MKYFILLSLSIWLLAGSSCKQPTDNKPPDGCDTCSHTCDTCSHPMDTTSHEFHWTEMQLPGENNATACWVFNEHCIYVVNGYVHIFNGASWSGVTLLSDDPLIERNLNGELSGYRMFAFDTNDYWLVRGLVHHYHGNTLVKTYRDELEGALLKASWGTSSKDMFFVGDSGTIMHFDGSTWITYPRVTDRNLYSVWGTSRNDVWACGYDPTTAQSVVTHFDGQTWTCLDNTTIGDIGVGRHGVEAVWSCDSAGHRKTYLTGSLVWHQLENSKWLSDSALLDNSMSGGFVGLYRVCGNTANDVLTAGGWGFVTHWNGSTWHRFDQLYAPGASGYATKDLHVKGNTACVVGYKNGTSWVAIGRR